MTTKTCASFGLALILTALVTTSAQARSHRQVTSFEPTFDRHSLSQQYVTVNYAPTQEKQRIRTRHEHYGVVKTASRVHDTSSKEVAHPSGCPSRAFCGCGVAVYVFGKPIRDLWLAANWLRRFPPASAAAGMVAARAHHVMVILEAHGDGTATVYDPNSGGHRTRIHRRSLAGYRVVNPHGSRYATTS